MIQDVTSGYILKRIESRFLKRELYTYIHSSIIQNSQKVEATRVPIDDWMEKRNVIYPHS